MKFRPNQTRLRPVDLIEPGPFSPFSPHPRVYLAVEDAPNHEAVCPYCGAHYRLID